MNAAEAAYVEELEDKARTQAGKIIYLEEQLEWLKRHVFGQRSEKVVDQVDVNQLYLDGFAPTDITTDQGERATDPRSKGSKRGGLRVKTGSPSPRIFLSRR